MKALGREGDVAVALSTSGNSPNVLRAIEACKKAEIVTVALTGGDGGKLAPLVDHHLCVSASRLAPRIQETHILAGHVICELVDCKLFGATRERVELKSDEIDLSRVRTYPWRRGREGRHASDGRPPGPGRR